MSPEWALSPEVLRENALKGGADPLLALVVILGYLRASFVRFSWREDFAALSSDLPSAFECFGNVLDRLPDAESGIRAGWQRPTLVQMASAVIGVHPAFVRPNSLDDERWLANRRSEHRGTDGRTGHAPT